MERKNNITLDLEVPIRDEDTMGIPPYGSELWTAQKTVSIRFLLEKMLINSDNIAIKILLRYIDPAELGLAVKYFSIDLNVYYNAKKAPSAGVTPQTVSNVLLGLYKSNLLTQENSEYLLSLLSRVEFNMVQYAGLPENVKIAHKFGDNYYNGKKIFHDCGIMYLEKNRILYCIMTKGLERENAMERTRKLIRAIYDYSEDWEKIALEEKEWDI